MNKKHTHFLDDLRENITADFTRRKITKDQYEKLVEEVSIKYREVINNELYTLDSIPMSERRSIIVELKRIIKTILP